MIFTPVTFLFWFNDTGAIGRKEILLLTLFVVNALWFDQNKFSNIKMGITLVLLSFITFMHELPIFYFIYFVILHFLNNKGKQTLETFAKLTMIYALAVVIPGFLLFLYGSDINNGRSYEFLMERGITLTGGIFADNTITKEVLLGLMALWSWYIVSFFYGLILVIIVLKKINRIKLMYYFFLALVVSVPLFILGIDWGRWIFIHFMLILIIIGTLLEKRKDGEKNIFRVSSKQKYLFVFLISNLLFSMPLCAKGFVLGSNLILFLQICVDKYL